eukprot:Rmarinus@m.24015
MSQKNAPELIRQFTGKISLHSRTPFSPVNGNHCASTSPQTKMGKSPKHITPSNKPSYKPPTSSLARELSDFSDSPLPQHTSAVKMSEKAVVPPVKVQVSDDGIRTPSPRTARGLHRLNTVRSDLGASVVYSPGLPNPFYSPHVTNKQKGETPSRKSLLLDDVSLPPTPSHTDHAMAHHSERSTPQHGFYPSERATPHRDFYPGARTPSSTRTSAHTHAFFQGNLDDEFKNSLADAPLDTDTVVLADVRTPQCHPRPAQEHPQLPSPLAPSPPSKQFTTPTQSGLHTFFHEDDVGPEDTPWGPRKRSPICDQRTTPVSLHDAPEAATYTPRRAPSAVSARTNQTNVLLYGVVLFVLSFLVAAAGFLVYVVRERNSWDHDFRPIRAT